MPDFDPWAKQKTSTGLTDQVGESSSATISSVECLLITILATLAMLVAGYLTGVSLLSDSGPAGCGADSGCGQVLASKWSKLWHLPVSGLATLTYLFIGVIIWLVRSHSARLQQLAWTFLLVIAGAVASSAIWFVYLQFVVVGEICPYCMFDHACSLIIAIYLVIRAPIRRVLPVMKDQVTVNLPFSKGIGMMIVGIAITSVMATAQSNSREAIHQVQGVDNHGDFIRGQGSSRQVGVLDGQLKLTLANEPLIGQMDASKVIVILFDYACLHCRHTHEAVTKYQEQHPGKLAVIALPSPVNSKCNPHITADIERFQHSCELAEIALAVWFVDRSKFGEFDTWLFDSSQPRTPDQAKRQAKKLIGEQRYEQSLNDQRIKTMIKRNVDAFGASKADRVPVIVMPFIPSVVGRLEDTKALEQLFEQSRLSSDADLQDKEEKKD